MHTSLWSPEALHSPWGYIHTHRLSCKQGQASLGIPAFQKKVLSFQEAQRLPRPQLVRAGESSGLGLGKSKHQARPSLQGQWAHPSASWSQEGTRKGTRGPRGAASGKAGGDHSPTETWPNSPHVGPARKQVMGG